MPAVETKQGPTRLSVIFLSWLAASVATPLALVAAVFGQAIGALAGGCQWSGGSWPLARPVWALVNQPVLNFSSVPGASGYWLGSTLLPLIAGAAIIGFFPRTRSLFAELGCIQIAWAFSTISLAWLPLIDAKDGHLSRFLALHNWPSGWVWLAPMVAGAIALLPALRLLELARRHRPEIRRISRVFVVVVHFGVPTTAWVVMSSLVHGTIPKMSMIAMAVPVVSAVVFGWLRYPAPYAHSLEAPKASEAVALVIAALGLAGGLWLAGRPLPNDRSAGLLWGTAHSLNNIRPWVETHSIK